MKRRSILLIWGWAVLIVCCFAGTSFGAGIVLKLDNSTLTNQGGSSFAPTYTGPGSAGTANIEFFPGGVPSDPTSTSGRNDSFSYTLLSGPIYQYDNLNINGGSVSIRSWSGTPRTQGSHYGISSGYAAASGASPALQYNVSTFQTIYLADVPTNKPTISSASESNQRIGSTSNVVLNLSISYSYSSGSSPNLIPASGYDVRYWKEPETESGTDADLQRIASTSGTSWSLPATDPKTGNPFGSGTYHFKVRAKNVFGAGPYSDVFNWTTLAGGAGGPETKSYVFLRETGGLGVNTFTVPYSTINNPSVSNLLQLIQSINTQAGKNVVYTLGWWDSTTMKPAGYEVKYKSTSLNDIDSITSTTGLQSPDQVTIQRDKAYQVYVIETTSATFEGTR
jgi:hypothetical protein